MLRKCHEKSMGEAMGEIPAARDAEKEAGRSRRGVPRREETDGGRSRVDAKLEMPKTHAVELERGKPEIAARILALLRDGPMRPSAMRKAIGISSGIHFNRYCLSPMLARGLIARTDPEHPRSPQQK